MPQEIPVEVQQQIAAAIGAVKDMNEVELRDALINNHEVTPEDGVTQGWMRKKLKYLTQQMILESAGLKETEAMAESHEAATETAESNGEKKPGRKKIAKTGTFRLELGEGGSIGREGSWKNGILKRLQAIDGPFTYDQFVEATADTGEWNAQAETFGKNTKFPSLNACANAWFSELKNKAKIIVQDEAAG